MDSKVSLLAFYNTSTTISFLAIVTNMVVVSVLLKRRDLRTSWNVVNLPLNISESLFSLMNMACCIGIQFRPLTAPSLECTIQGMLAVQLAMFSTFSLILIAWERYQAICFGKSLRVQVWVGMTLAILAYSFLCCLLPLLNPLGYVVTGSGHYCMVPWYSDDWFGKLISCMALFNITLATVVIGYCYLRIYHFYQKLKLTTTRAKVSSTFVAPQNPAETAAASQIEHPKSREVPSSPTVRKQVDKKPTDKKDRIIFLKSLFNVMIFGTLWLPYIMLIILEISTEEQASQNWYLVATFFADLASLINPLALILLSPAIWTEIKSWLGYKLEP